MADGEWRMVDGGWRMADGGWWVVDVVGREENQVVIESGGVSGSILAALVVLATLVGAVIIVKAAKYLHRNWKANQPVNFASYMGEMMA